MIVQAEASDFGLPSLAKLHRDAHGPGAAELVCVLRARAVIAYAERITRTDKASHALDVRSPSNQTDVRIRVLMEWQVRSRAVDRLHDAPRGEAGKKARLGHRQHKTSGTADWFDGDPAVAGAERTARDTARARPVQAPRARVA
jgi:hypothetical protein